MQVGFPHTAISVVPNRCIASAEEENSLVIAVAIRLKENRTRSRFAGTVKAILVAIKSLNRHGMATGALQTCGRCSRHAATGNRNRSYHTPAGSDAREAVASPCERPTLWCISLHSQNEQNRVAFHQAMQHNIAQLLGVTSSVVGCTTGYSSVCNFGILYRSVEDPPLASEVDLIIFLITMAAGWCGRRHRFGWVPTSSLSFSLMWAEWRYTIDFFNFFNFVLFAPHRLIHRTILATSTYHRPACNSSSR